MTARVLPVLACALFGFAVALGCGRDEPAPASFSPGEVEFRGPPGSGEPSLSATADGRVLLSWLEKTEADGWALRMAERRDARWSEARTVTEREAFFVNWADFPSVTELADGVLLAHWLETVADAPYAYHLMLSLSRDGGRSWGDPIVPHRDDSPTEHGFASVVPWLDGAVLVWLDGREMAEGGSQGGAAGALRRQGGGNMTLRASTVDREGRLGEEVLLDDRTCECCQTALVRTPDGLVAAYRDRDRRKSETSRSRGSLAMAGARPGPCTRTVGGSRAVR